MAPDSNQNEEKQLKTAQTKAIAALLSEADIKTAAKTAGVGERTLHTWLKEDETFRQALKAAEQAAIDTAIVGLAGAIGESLKVIKEVRDNQQTSPGIRLRAADLILTHTLNFKRLWELENEVAELHQLIEEINERADYQAKKNSYIA